MEAEATFTLNINGQNHTVDVPPDMPLLWLLRDVVGLTGTKFGCGIALCGACTVHLAGQAVRSCVLPISAVGDKPIITIEAVEETPAGQRIQKAWLDIEVIQCGYCQPGQVMSAAALLAHSPTPTDAEIDVAMAGNICRCGTYVRIREAIKLAATGQSDAVMPMIPLAAVHNQKVD
jgi:isoquinoline 1-oxidoreductase alpha subunit